MIANLLTINVPSGQNFFEDAELVSKFVDIIESKSQNVGRSFSGIEVSESKIKRLDIFEESVPVSDEFLVKSMSFREALSAKGYSFAFLSGEVSQEVADDKAFFGTFKELQFENGKLLTALV